MICLKIKKYINRNNGDKKTEMKKAETSKTGMNS